MPQRISAAPHEYAGRQYQVGDPFDCEAQDVALLLAIGRIAPEAGEPGYVDRDLTAAAPAPYATRDMAAARTKRPYQRKAH